MKPQQGFWKVEWTSDPKKVKAVRQVHEPYIIKVQRGKKP
jgi:hypothetical protein